MTTQAIDVVTTIVKDQRHYIRFDGAVSLRKIYSFGFWIKLTENERQYFGWIFKPECESLGFKHAGYKNGINIYMRIY